MVAPVKRSGAVTLKNAIEVSERVIETAKQLSGEDLMEYGSIVRDHVYLLIRLKRIARCNAKRSKKSTETPFPLDELVEIVASRRKPWTYPELLEKTGRSKTTLQVRIGQGVSQGRLRRSKGAGRYGKVFVEAVPAQKGSA